MKKDSFFPLVPKFNSLSALFRVLLLSLLALVSVNVASFLGLKDTSDPTTTLAKNHGVLTKDGSDGLGTVDKDTGAVLGVNTLDDLVFAVKVPAIFNDSVRIGNLEVVDSISAPNIIKKLKAGLGINVSNSSNADGSGTEPVVTNTGVLSLQGEIGAIVLEAGTGMSIDGLKLSNDDLGSSQAIFKTFSVAGQSDVVADSNTDTLRLIGSGGITITTSANDDSITINSASPDYTLSGWTKTGTVVALTTPTDAVTLASLSADSLRVSGVSVLNGGITLGNGKAILPDTDLGSDLGSADYRFNNLWVGTINSNSSVSYSGQTKFTYEPKDTNYTESSVMINPTAPVTNGQLLGLGVAGYQRALIDEDGDISLGYADATSAPVSDYPLNVYGHSGTRVSFVDTSGNGYFAGNVGIGTESPATALEVKGKIRIADGIQSTSGTLEFGNGQNYIQAYSTSMVFDRTYDMFDVRKNGTTQFRIDQAGKVGIGTTNPGYNLDVNGTTRSIAFRLNSGYWDASTFSLPITGTGYYRIMTASQPLAFWTSGSETMRLDATGNLGIGTTAPTYKLDVAGDAKVNNLAFLTKLYPSNTSSNTDWIEINHNSGFMGFGMGSSERMRILNTGNVGIGTTDPGAYKLNVNGSFFAGNSSIRGTNVSSAGILTARYDDNGLKFPLVLENLSSAYNDEGVGMSFDLSASGGTPIIAGRITVQKEQDWGSTVDRDSYMSFSTIRDYTLAEKMRLTSGGNLGIGTTAPSRILHLFSNNSSSTGIKLEDEGTGGRTYSFFSTNDNSGLGGGKFGVYDDTAGVARLAIDSSGNVGIGTTSPGYTLDVNGNFRTAYGNLKIISSGNTPFITSATGKSLRLTSGEAIADSSGITINANNIGIGTTSPAFKLDVLGTSNFSGETSLSRASFGASGATNDS